MNKIKIFGIGAVVLVTIIIVSALVISKTGLIKNQTNTKSNEQASTSQTQTKGPSPTKSFRGQVINVSSDGFTLKVNKNEIKFNLIAGSPAAKSMQEISNGKYALVSASYDTEAKTWTAKRISTDTE